MGDPVDPLLSPAYHHLHFQNPSQAQNEIYIYKNNSPGPSSPSHRNSPAQDIFHHTDPPIEPDSNVDEEPLYVNAKQYFRILKRRVARARLEEVHRLSRQRKVRLLFFPFLPSLTPSLPSPISTSLATSMRCVVPVARVAAS